LRINRGNGLLAEDASYVIIIPMYNFSPFKQKNKDVEEWLKKELSNVRTGRANVAILDGVQVESYGSMVPLSQVGNLATEDPKTIRISPWDMTQIKAIEKGILLADLGVSVTVDDKGLRVIFPELTGERRLSLVKHAKQKLEDAKVSLRMHRDDVMKDLQAKEKAGGIGKDDIFRFKTELQKIVDETNKKLEEQFAKKEKEITS
jgi:ribosome recycling factor